jgi:hypothetical protein
MKFFHIVIGLQIAFWVLLIIGLIYVGPDVIQGASDFFPWRPGPA